VLPHVAARIGRANEVVGDIADKSVLDAALIASAQAVEHYEITRYGALIAWAREMGHDEVIPLLEATLQEERSTDEQLSDLAETFANARADRVGVS